MEVQPLMACPVCTLYLREGMSMQSHLNTHPKDQVIEALVRLYTSERNVQPSYSPQPSPILNPFMMVSEEQIVMGRQQVTSILHPQVMSYPIYQQQHFLSSSTEYLSEQSECNRQEIQPIATSSDTGTVTTIINVSGHQEFAVPSNRDVNSIIGEGIVISSEATTQIEKTVGKTEVFIVEPAGHDPPLSPGSDHSARELGIRPDFDQSEKADDIETTICEEFITADCDYQDEDARQSADILTIGTHDHTSYNPDVDEIQRESSNSQSCSGLNIQSDEQMPAKGELSGQESLGNTTSSIWIPEVRSEGLPIVTISTAWNEKCNDFVRSSSENIIIERGFQCLYCSETFKCPKERRVHIASHHVPGGGSIQGEEEPLVEKEEKKVTVCIKCGLQVGSPKELKEHIQKEHRKTQQVVRKCGVCQEIFTTKETYSEHLIKVHPLECTICGKTFHTKAGLSMHSKIHLEVKPHPCTLCSKSFVTGQKLREHMNSHTGFAPIQCNMCDRKFKRYSNLKQHKDVAHFKVKKKIKEFFCECGEAFLSKKKLAWHEEIHLDKPRQCMYCSERYIHNNSLTRHIRRMHDENYLPPSEGSKPRNVECPMCAQVFVESSLRAHMKQHSSPKQFSCIICGKKFRTKWNLHLHRWTHASRVSKPYKCNQCKGAFVRLGDFQAHIRSHFGHKPYTCNHCGMQFNRKHNLQRHEKEHNGPKRYACTDCGKTFHRSYYLIEHVRIHTGVRPFSCHICNKTSTTKSNHNKHLRTHHARETVNTEG